jgi:glycosyltransferase involved in cell wall biosynthesis/tetratricopeptide (TPR) repeat protein/GT2 family glycosyltransferase/SAM-dependent methyltransferase
VTVHDVRERLAALVPATSRRVLEIGCGAGEVGAAVKARLPDCRVTGLEPDEALAAAARERLDEVIVSPVSSLQFPDAAFDAIVLTDVLAHLDEARALLQALRALLSADGLLVAWAPAAASLRALGDALGTTAASAPVRRYARRELAVLLEESGWDATSLVAVFDPALAWIPLPLDGASTNVEHGRFLLRALTADELYDLTASAVLVTALPRLRAPMPQCSIIVAGEAAGVAATIERLRRDPPRATCEVIALPVGDAARIDAGARVVAHPRPLARTEARNAGARLARGVHLAFLDAGALPEPGWLDALLAARRRHARAAAVGAKLVRPDGTIAQAGTAFGGRDLPNHALPFALYAGTDAGAPFVSRERRVSALTGSGVVVTREAFVVAGGYDERFPGWYADADLCLALRARGFEIVYAPGAVVVDTVDLRDIAHPTDVRAFIAKWPGGLAPDEHVFYREDGTDPETAYGVVREGEDTVTPVVWTSFARSATGYGEEARSFIAVLRRAGVDVRPNAITSDGPMLVPDADTAPRALTDGFIHVVHTQPRGGETIRFRRHPRASRHIGRTMFETDRVPAHWVGPCNDMDEVWVPSSFNRETFARAGVARDRIFVVPGALPMDPYRAPGPPLRLRAPGFVFLSTFAWGRRKGWDVLAQAWLEEFRRGEPVSLLCHVTVQGGRTLAHHRRELEDYIRDELGRDVNDAPPIILSGQILSAPDMVRLYHAADAFVLPTRGEAWGRPFMEAMAAGVPVIATGWSGYLDFMDEDTAWLIDATVADVPEEIVREVPEYLGHRHAVPSVDHLRSLLRRVFTDQRQTAAKAERARSRVVEQCSWARVGAIVEERLGHDVRLRRRPPAGAPRRSRLSVCMIVRDEEPRLRACLASVREVADQIVVVDTGSVDRTREVARELGAEVSEVPWTDDWAAARNASLARATGDWILVIDADQTVEPSSLGELRRLIARDVSVGYLLRQRNYMEEEGTEAVFEHLIVRLFPNRPDIRYAGRIHEQVTRTSGQPLPLERCGVILHHDGYRSAAARRGKAERDLPVLERAIADEPDEPFHVYNLGVTLQALGRFADAETAARRAIELGMERATPGRMAGYVLAAHVLLATALTGREEHAEAAEMCRRALAIAPEFSDAWCTLGGIELRRGRAQQALEAYERALGCPPSLPAGWTDAATAGWKARLGIAQAALRLGRWEEALASAEEAWRAGGRNTATLEALRTALAALLALDPDRAALHRLQGQVLTAGGDLEGALACLRRALELDPGDPDSLAAAGAVLLALGAATESEQAYREALARRPGWTEARRGLEEARVASAAMGG